MMGIKVEEKGGRKRGSIQGALAYVRIAKPDTKIGESEKVFATTVVVDSETGKEFKKMFPKNSCTAVETSDVKEKLGIEAPNPDAPMHYIIKLRANAQLKADAPKAGLKKGDDVPYDWQPKVVMDREGVPTDVTKEVMVGNGSTGVVEFEINENGSFGISAKLAKVTVEKLVEMPPKPGDQSAPYVPRPQVSQSQQPAQSTPATVPVTKVDNDGFGSF